MNKASANLDSILHQVTKPARYTGGEWNSILKDWDKTPIRIALSYPDLYEIEEVRRVGKTHHLPPQIGSTGWS